MIDRGPAMLTRLRVHAALGACLFAALIVLVTGERRLSEVHLNRLSSAPVFENDDALDGDEIRIRLTLHADAEPPIVSPTVTRLAPAAVPRRPLMPSIVIVDGHSPRAPPR
jgi:hypothetical protein